MAAARHPFPLAALLAVLLCARASAAQTVEELPDSAVAGSERGDSSAETRDVIARITFIQRALDEAEGPAVLWHWGWLAAFGTFAIGSGVRATVFGDTNRAVGIVDAVASLIGAISVIVTPQPTMNAGRRLRAYLASTRDGPRERLAHAEQVLFEAGESQNFELGWFSQLGRIAVPAIGAAVLRFAFGYGDEAGMDLAVGLTIGQLSAISHPGGAVTAWRRYVRAHPSAARRTSWLGGHALSYAIVPSPTGVSLLVRF